MFFFMDGTKSCYLKKKIENVDGDFITKNVNTRAGKRLNFDVLQNLWSQANCQGGDTKVSDH